MKKTLKDDFEEIAFKYHRIYSKPIGNSFVSRDFLRLANKFILSTQNSDKSEMINNLFAKEINPEVIVTVLNELSHHVESESRRKLVTVEILNKNVKSLDEHESFSLFLSSFYGEESSVVKVLKCCSQTYIVLLLGSLGFHLFTACQLRAKDIRGTWHLIIKKSRSGIVSVAHRRTEQCVRQVGSNHLVDFFKFTWEVEMTFTSDMTHFSKVEANVIDIDWGTEKKDQNLETIFTQVFSNPIEDDLNLEKLNISVEEFKKNIKNLGPLRKIPKFILTERILSYFNPTELLLTLSTVNSSFRALSLCDSLWARIIQSQEMKFEMSSPYYRFYRQCFTYWSLEEPKKGTVERKYYSLSKKKMIVSNTQKKFKGDKKSVRPILTSKPINPKFPQLFRTHFKSGVISGCGISLCTSDGEMKISYNADGSITIKNRNVITLDNRIRDKKRVIIPLEKDFVFNVLVDPSEKKISFFFNSNFEDRFICSFTPSLFDQEIRFGVKVNLKQEIEVLPSVKLFSFPFCTRKKLRRVY